jgi:cysteine desulfurase
LIVVTVRRRIYLDYNASAPLRPQALAAMQAALQLNGNPSSVHAEGRALRGVIEAARDDVAALVGARPADVIFTSGATEANATVFQDGWDTILRANVEHDSVLAPCDASGARVVALPVNTDGVIETGAIAEAILLGGVPLGRALIAVQLANNETGVIQPVAEIAAFARAHGVATHCDGVQGVGRMPVSFEALGVDTLAVSAHKLGGPKGIGALVVREGSNFEPLLRGGGQERRRRAGTEDVVAIAGFGAAARAAREVLAQRGRIAALRERLENGVLQATPDAVVFGCGSLRLDNTTCVSTGRSADILVIKFDVAGFAVSSGSACSSGKVSSSHVLAAMGVAPHLSGGAIRISVGADTTAEEVEAFLATWRDVHGVLGVGQGAQSARVEARMAKAV